MSKATKMIFAALAMVLILSTAFLPEAYADHKKSKVEHGDYYKDKHDDKEKRQEKTAAGFTDRETITLSLPNGVMVETVIRVKKEQLLIPVQSIFEACEIPYILYPKEDILEGFANGKHFIFHEDKKAMYLDGQKQKMPVKAFETSGQFYVPLKTIAEVIGYTIVLDSQNNLIKFE